MSFIYQPNGMASQILSNSKTFSATGAVSIPIFRVTGSVRFLRIWGVVTTVLNSNITAASFEMFDQTAHTAITSAAGTTISAAPVGSMIAKTGLAATALTLKSAAAGALSEPGAVGEFVTSSAFDITQKTGGINTDIQFLYTKDAGASSGVIQFFVEFIPLSADGAVAAV